jgi:transcriptional antiterminator RfaH
MNSNVVRDELRKRAWFCLQSHPKHEHIAAAHLRVWKLEVYLPQIRFQRRTRCGLRWVTEALFPNYFFARLQLGNAFRFFHYARGVQGIVHFGNHWPTVPDAVINNLRDHVGADHAHIVQAEFSPGQTVEIGTGAFRGLEAVVTRLMPRRQRVALLLDFLGSQARLELPSNAVLSKANTRMSLLNAHTVQKPDNET